MQLPEPERRLETLRVMFLGDSITRQQYFPNRVFDFLKSYISTNVSTIGRVSLNNFVIEHYAENARPGLKTESYNGWPTYWYLNQDFVFAPDVNPESDVSRSPFWFGPSLDRGELSFAKYIAEYAEGRFPHVMIIMLGTNDFAGSRFQAAEHYRLPESRVERATKSMHEIITLVRRDSPDTQIFVVSPPPTSLSWHVFKQIWGNDTQSSPLTFKYGHRLLVDSYRRAFDNRESEGIYFVPAHVGMDPIDGYHKDQVVHPSAFGHGQIANQINAALNRWLANGAGGLAARP